jgi:hypothetical protein
MIDWGNVPAWFAAVGTPVALGLTAVGLKRERDRNREERRDREATLRRGQAVGVTAWTDRMGVPQADDLEAWRYPNVWTDTDTAPIAWVIAIRIRNVSDAPVYEVCYELEAGVRGRYLGRIPSMPPAATMEVLIPLPAYPRFDWATPRIRFRDADNPDWWRTNQGELKEGPPPDHLFKPDAGAYLEAPSNDGASTPAAVRRSWISLSRRPGHTAGQPRSMNVHGAQHRTGDGQERRR